MDITSMIGYLAAALMFTTFYMKKMIPLRAVAACANLTFVVYSSIAHVYPLLVLHAALLPLNLTRMVQMMRLVKKVKEAASGSFSFDFLVPFMKKEQFAKGDVVFRRGDRADKLLFLQSGRVRLDELNITMSEGELIGDIGIFSANKTRSATVTCETDVVFLSILDSQVLQLYYQNPKFGFYLMQLMINRVLRSEEARKGASGQAIGPAGVEV